MKYTMPMVVGWYHAVVAGTLPWIGVLRPAWLPAALVMTVVVHRRAMRIRAFEPWRSVVVGASALIALCLFGGLRAAVGWLGLAAAVALAHMVLPRVDRAPRPDLLDLAAGAVWATVALVRPELLQPEAGGWVTALVLVLAVRRAVTETIDRRTATAVGGLGPPSREVRGTLGFSGVVAGDDGLARSVELEFEVRAGSSLAIFSDDAHADDLAMTLLGERELLEGQISVDGIPPAPGDRLMATIGRGGEFLVGGLDDNISALVGASVAEAQRAAIFEACALGEIEAFLEERRLSRDGSPLSGFHRLLLQAARVIPSHYRILLVVDPMAWVNPVRAEIWRTAVVRASIGRTAVWITGDRRLAGRAERMLEFRHGTLRPGRKERN